MRTPSTAAVCLQLCAGPATAQDLGLVSFGELDEFGLFADGFESGDTDA